MSSILNKIILIVFISFLSACSTWETAAEKEDHEQVIATAKLNTQLGMDYLESKNVQRAKEKFLLALNEAPDIPEPWYSMAYYLEATGDKDQAQKYYLKAISLNPSRGDSQNNYGTFLCRSGEYKLSIQHFMLAVQDPNYIDTSAAYENAGLCAMKIPNKQLAKKYFRRALMQDPSRKVAMAQLKKLMHVKKSV